MPLRAPSGLTARPTAVRAREALFASLGTLDGMTVADLFAGTGAIGLEAASSCNAVKANCAKAESIAPTAVFEIFNAPLPNICKRLAVHPQPDLIFADPPYAESAELLAKLLADPDFSRWSGKALLIWEMAENKGGLQPPPSNWQLETIRNFGGAKFLYLRQK